MIYQFLLTLVQTKPPADALQAFCTLFFEYKLTSENAAALEELSALLAANNPQAFNDTLKRCCYILINNWDSKRDRDFIRKLIEAFKCERNFRSPSSAKQARLYAWIATFRCSPDYEDLNLYTCKFVKTDEKESHSTHWSDRYAAYRLVAQYANEANSQEQRRAALARSQALKDKFKFDLAMYATRSQLVSYRNKPPENPTSLGENVLRIVKKIVLRKGYFNYANLANIFVKQTQDCAFKVFKDALVEYLFFASENRWEVDRLSQKLSIKVRGLYLEREDDLIDSSLFLRSCKRTIDFLTTESGKLPSELFNYLWFEGSPLTLVTLLLKIALICPNARTHLETRIAQLIEIYQQLPEEDCTWAVNFFEIFKIAFAIYADNDVRYDLISMETENARDRGWIEDAALDSYRIYSQCFENWNLSSIQSSRGREGDLPESYFA